MIGKGAVHFFIWLVYAVMWALHLDYITSAVGHTYVMW